MKAKFIGAGSIGIHLARAARTLGWSVGLCDNDPAALSRTQNSIYPSRYRSWDTDITLFDTDDDPSNIYEIIFIGTPPDSLVSLALQSLN